MDAKQNISSIRHFLKKRHWVSDVFAGMCLSPKPVGGEGASGKHAFSREVALETSIVVSSSLRSLSSPLSSWSSSVWCSLFSRHVYHILCGAPPSLHQWIKLHAIVVPTILVPPKVHH